MIPLIQAEACDKKKWVKQEEIFDIIAISESTPGPVAVNAATFIGYKVMGIWGGILATLGLALPSFVIIFLLSLIYQQVMNIPVIIAMFKGIKVAVILLLISAVVRLSKNVKKDIVSIILFSIVIIMMIVLAIFNINIPFITIGFIALGLLTGIVLTIIAKNKEKLKWFSLNCFMYFS